LLQKRRFKVLLTTKYLLPVTCLAAALQLCNLQAGQGTVRYIQHAGPNWDSFTSTSDPAVQTSIRNTLFRIETYAPYFNAKLSWMPRAFVYFDSYAIYTNSPLATAHPEWILKGSLGQKLYIPWGCSGGTCPQYAGDISNPAFVAYQIAQITSYIGAGGSPSNGYSGLFLDDVNLGFTVSDVTGAFVAPIDSNTHQPMSLTNWQMYFARYVEAVRNALPKTVEIIHNSQWAVSQNQYVSREITAADYVNMERGFGDTGLTGGSGQFSLATYMQFVDYVHSLGSAVIIDDYYLANQTYSLASYFLVQNGSDAFGIEEQTPANWPASLYSINLGPPSGSRYRWQPSVWRRDFANGFVLVNEPGAAPQVLSLPTGTTDANGNPVSTVTLNAMQGGIYLLPTPVTHLLPATTK
jgi:hypothetical protein